MYFWPSEAHNGYLDVVNDLGFVGPICLLGYLTVFVRQSLQLFRTDRPQGALYLALFFQQAMTNLSESCWFSPMGILPVFIMTLSTFTLARVCWISNVRAPCRARASLLLRFAIGWAQENDSSVRSF